MYKFYKWVCTIHNYHFHFSYRKGKDVFSSLEEVKGRELQKKEKKKKKKSGFSHVPINSFNINVFEVLPYNCYN